MTYIVCLFSLLFVDSPMASQSVKRGPPPVPSYRSHLASRSSSDMSQPPDSESGSSSESGKVPSQDSSLPVAPPRKSQPSEEKPETEGATLHGVCVCVCVCVCACMYVCICVHVLYA